MTGYLQTGYIEDAKSVQELIDHLDVPEIVAAKLLKREGKPIPVIRLTLTIALDGKGRFRVERGLASDPPSDVFQGEEFNMSAFPHALAFRGNDGLGCIIWDYQDPDSAWGNSGYW